MKIINTLSGLIKDRKLAVFCGAGISYHSGLPLSNPLLQQLFAQIGLNEKEARTIFDAKLPFEGIAGVVAEATGSLGFTDGYQKGSPNTNHRLIAELANQGYLHLIVTTNFDTLIEQALEETGVPSERYQVFADEKEFIRIDWNTDKIIVVKIHGTIREKRKMAVTLKMIGQQQLTEERNRIIEQLFKEGRALLFLGYSFSDSFDLSPQIRLLGNRESEVYIIAHETCRLAPVKSRANKKAHYPFAGFPNAYEIKMDTDELVRLLSIAVLGSPPMPEKTKTIQWQIMLKRWFESRGLTNAALFDGIAGRLFYLATKYHVAELKYKAALSLASTAEQRCDQLRNLGIVYKELGDYKTALTFLHDAEKLTPGFTNKKLEASILNNIAYTYGAEKNYRKALDYQTRAMKMARSGTKSCSLSIITILAFCRVRWKSPARP
jgi:NAD-dependent SIR2 family protein deacetylase